MIKRYFIVSLFAFTLIIAYLLKRNQVIKDRYKKALNQVEKLDSLNKTCYAKIFDLSKLVKIDLAGYSTIILNDRNNKELKLSDLTGGGPKLIFRFPVNNIDESYARQFEKIKLLAGRIGSKNIIFLLSVPRNNDLQLLQSKMDLNLSFYNVKRTDLYKLQFERENVPYLFILDQHLQLTYPFVPENNISELSDNYYSRIEDLFDSF